MQTQREGKVLSNYPRSLRSCMNDEDDDADVDDSDDTDEIYAMKNNNNVTLIF